MNILITTDKNGSDTDTLLQKLKDLGHTVSFLTLTFDNKKDLADVDTVLCLGYSTLSLDVVRTAKKQNIPCVVVLFENIKILNKKQKSFYNCFDSIFSYVDCVEELLKHNVRARFYVCNEFGKLFEQMLKDLATDKESKYLLESDPEISKKAETKRLKSATSASFLGFFRLLFYFCIYIPALAIFDRLWYGLKIKNKKAFRTLKRKGGITICNHVHYMDNSFCAVAAFPKRLTFTSLPRNFRMPVIGGFVKVLGAVRTPTNYIETRLFFYALSKKLRQGKYVHIYPEGMLEQYCHDIRTFQNGAFHLAASSQSPIIPMRVIYRKGRGVHKFKKNPCLTLVVGDPIYPDYKKLYYEAVNTLKSQAKEAMDNLGKIQ